MMLKKYNKNLRLDFNNVYSYNTLVAIIDFKQKEILQSKYYSQTTQKHINYVAIELGLTLIKQF
jgi:hypothetical protein